MATMKIDTPEAREAMAGHKITWWVFTGGEDENGRPEKIRRTASMRGFWPGWDASCSCGWESRTGGAIKRSVQDSVDDHKWSVQCDAETAAGR